MKWKQVAPCLLALAGSVFFFAAVRGRAGEQSHSRAFIALSPRLADSKQLATRTPVPARFSRRVPVIAESLPALKAANLAPRRSVSIPMTFEPNLGQADPRAEFIGRGKGLTVFLTRASIAIQVANLGATQAAAAPRSTSESAKPRVLTLRLAGDSHFNWSGDAMLSGESNYFIGNDRSRWRTGVPHFARAQSATGSRNVSLAVYGNDGGVEYDLRLAPGADPAKLRLMLGGARDVRVDRAGDLKMDVGGRELTMRRPSIYQEVSDTTNKETPRAKHPASTTRSHSSHSRSSGPSRRVRGATRAKKYSPRTSHRPSTRGVKGGSSSKAKRAPKPCTSKSKSRRDVPCSVTPLPPKASKTAARRKRIPGSYVIEADGSVGFRVVLTIRARHS